MNLDSIKLYFPVFILVFLCACAFNCKSTKAQALPLFVINNKEVKEEVVSGDTSFIASATIKLLLSKLATEISPIYLPMSRTLRLMDEGEPICVTNKVKTDYRFQRYLFSLPLNFYPNYKLYKLGNAEIPDAVLVNTSTVKTVSSAVSSRPDSYFFHVPAISYGDQLDEDISQIPESQKYTSFSPTSFISMQKMFMDGKFDWLLLYPTQFYRNSFDNRAINISSFNVQGIPEVIPGYLMCSKTNEMRTFVADVNSALEDLYKTSGFLKAHTDFIDQADIPGVTGVIQKYKQTKSTL